MTHRILVTGGAGYLGSIMVPELLAAGHRVTVLDNFMYRQNGLAHVCNASAFDVVNDDIRSEETMKRLLNLHQGDPNRPGVARGRRDLQWLALDPDFALALQPDVLDVAHAGSRCLNSAANSIAVRVSNTSPRTNRRPLRPWLVYTASSAS